MKLIFRILPILLIMIILAGCGDNRSLNDVTMTGSTVSTKANADKAEAKLANTLDSFCQDNFSGSVLVAQGGKILFSKSYGMADYEKNISVNSKTTFNLGRASIEFTAVAIMMLEEKGMLKVEDKIKKYIPDFPNGDSISIHNLLTDSTGIQDYLVNDTIKQNQTYSALELIDTFKNKPLNFSPGSEFDPSLSNRVLLGYIIEKVTGETYDEFISKSIFKPLNMDNSGYYKDNSQNDNKAIGYTTIGKDYKKAKGYDPSAIYPEGNLYSTAEDLYKFDQVLNTEGLIKKESINKIFKPYINTPASFEGYGWAILSQDNNMASLAQLVGGTQGYTTRIVKNLNKKLTIIVLSNIHTADFNNREDINAENTSRIANIIEIINSALDEPKSTK